MQKLKLNCTTHFWMTSSLSPETLGPITVYSLEPFHTVPEGFQKPPILAHPHYIKGLPGDPGGAFYLEAN